MCNTCDFYLSMADYYKVYHIVLNYCNIMYIIIYVVLLVNIVEVYVICILCDIKSILGCNSILHSIHMYCVCVCVRVRARVCMHT